MSVHRDRLPGFKGKAEASWIVVTPAVDKPMGVVGAHRRVASVRLGGSNLAMRAHRSRVDVAVFSWRQWDDLPTFSRRSPDIAKLVATYRDSTFTKVREW